MNMTETDKKANPITGSTWPDVSVNKYVGQTEKERETLRGDTCCYFTFHIFSGSAEMRKQVGVQSLIKTATDRTRVACQKTITKHCVSMNSSE